MTFVLVAMVERQQAKNSAGFGDEMGAFFYLTSKGFTRFIMRSSLLTNDSLYKHLYLHLRTYWKDQSVHVNDVQCAFKDDGSLGSIMIVVVCQVSR